MSSEGWGHDVHPWGLAISVPNGPNGNPNGNLVPNGNPNGPHAC